MGWSGSRSGLAWSFVLTPRRRRPPEPLPGLEGEAQNTQGGLGLCGRLRDHLLDYGGVKELRQKDVRRHESLEDHVVGIASLEAGQADVQLRLEKYQ